ncbi:MAG: hypothetical protein KF802_14515 [Bdellovibrionaceae bacterium]|nr:hypothetical protein [Pseudobdellovibrionaceae bacterium]
MFSLCSPDFRDGENIPRTFTQEGENISPRLEWWDVPDEAEEMVLIWHHYKFHLYALNQRLDLRPGLDVKRLREAILPHIIADVEIMGRYRRDRRPLRTEERHP